MNQQELISKMERDEPLTAAEVVWLDAALLEGSREAEQRMLSLRPSEPSLQWRAGLNEKLRASARRSRLARIGSIAALPAAAAVVTFVAILAGNVDRVTLDSETILQWHDEAVASTVLPGDGTGMAGFATQRRPSKSDPNEDLLYGGRLESL
jgi:hypothetical protein